MSLLPDDYAAYAKYFVDDLPYNADELRAMATLSEERSCEKGRFSLHRRREEPPQVANNR
jgi:hypothetical protein